MTDRESTSRSTLLVAIVTGVVALTTALLGLAYNAISLIVIHPAI